MIGEQVSLAKATNLEKANHFMDEILRYFQANEDILKTDGILRLSGQAAIIEEFYQKYNADPSQIDFKNETAFIADPHNITGLLKRVINKTDLECAPEVKQILRAELERSFDAGGILDMEKVIKQLIAKNYLQEAKLLQNMLYLSHLIALQSQHNRMPSQNLYVIVSAWMASMIDSKDPMFETKLGLVAASVSQSGKDRAPIDALGINKTDANGKSPFEDNFDNTHPAAAEEVWQNRSKIPSRPDKAVTSKSSWRDRFMAYAKLATDWVVKTAYPVVKNAINTFFTKTLPSFFKRFTGSKTNEEPLLPDKMAIPPELLAAKQQAEAARAEAAKAKEWQAGPGHKAERDSGVIMGFNRPPNLGDPPLPPEPSEVSKPMPTRRPPILTRDEAEGAKQAREEGLKHFQELESKATPPRPPVPPRKILTTEESEAAIQARKEGLKHFQELEAKGTRPDVPPRKRPIVSTGERPAVPPRRAGPAVAADKKTERPLPTPPSKDNKPK